VLTGEAGSSFAADLYRARGGRGVPLLRARPKDTQITGFLEVPAELIVEVLSDDTSWAEMEKKIGEYHATASIWCGWLIPARDVTRIRARGLAGLLREATSRTRIRPCLDSPAGVAVSSPTEGGIKTIDCSTSPAPACYEPHMTRGDICSSVERDMGALGYRESAVGQASQRTPAGDLRAANELRRYCGWSALIGRLDDRAEDVRAHVRVSEAPVPVSLRPR